jgi:hypothetical protein
MDWDILQCTQSILIDIYVAFSVISGGYFYCFPPSSLLACIVQPLDWGCSSSSQSHLTDCVAVLSASIVPFSSVPQCACQIKLTLTWDISNHLVLVEEKTTFQKLIPLPSSGESMKPTLLDSPDGGSHSLRSGSVGKSRLCGYRWRRRFVARRSLFQILNSCNACCHSVQNLLSSRLPSKNAR